MVWRNNQELMERQEKIMFQKKSRKQELRSLSKTEKTILILLSRDLFKVSRSIPEGVDWEEVYQECRHQSVSVLAWNAL